jgi:hypothetical protein
MKAERNEKYESDNQHRNDVSSAPTGGSRVSKSKWQEEDNKTAREKDCARCCSLISNLQMNLWALRLTIELPDIENHTLQQ